MAKTPKRPPRKSPPKPDVKLEPMHHLRALRVRRMLTQRQLAQAAGVVPGYLLQIEMGRRDPSLSVLKRLARALRVTPGQLLDGPR
jgi:transcriptional regulator with XRE-family HTH domain